MQTILAFWLASIFAAAAVMAVARVRSRQPIAIRLRRDRGNRY